MFSTVSLRFTDANGCDTTLSLTLVDPPSLIASITGTDPLCFGDANGTANVVASGGTAPYTYLWNNGATTNSISGLIAGTTYTVTVTDSNSCDTTLSITLVDPPLLIASITGTDPLCFGDANGTANVVASGGTAPYTYLWNTGATTNSISGLIAGTTYTVTVTDSNSCDTTLSITLVDPPLLIASITGTDPLCFGDANGTANVVASGGTAPYTYLWNTGATTNSISGLIAGTTYTVTVTDSNSCDTTLSITLV